MKPEDIEYPYPRHGDKNELKDILGKTLGVPLFQEQAMRIAIEAAKFTPDEANQLRRAMATFRHVGTIRKFEEKMVGNLIARGYTRGVRQKLLQPDQGLRRIRFSREPRRRVRAAGLCLVMAEMFSSRCVLLRAVEFAADGILRAGADRRRCPQEWRRGTRDRCFLQPWRQCAGGALRRSIMRCGSAFARSTASGGSIRTRNPNCHSGAREARTRNMQIPGSSLPRGPE